MSDVARAPSAGSSPRGGSDDDHVDGACTLVADLSRQEHEIAGYLVDEYTVPHISQMTGLTEKQVQGKIRVLFSKLGIADRAELRGLAPPISPP